MKEFDEKLGRVQALLAERHLDALVLRRVSSIAWATCGASAYVNTATTEGSATLLYTPSRRYVITNNIEATRMEREERLAAQGWELQVSQWYQKDNTISELTRGLVLGADVPFSNAENLADDFARLRSRLTPEEGDRFRTVGHLCAEAMDSAIRSVRPGQSEYEIASILGAQAQKRGLQPIVNLIATDQRIYQFRHPLPTDKKLERYAMLVLCGRKWGLVGSITRLVHFGPLPAELVNKSRATAQVDANLILGTRPGRTLAQVFQQATSAYAEAGFADEWKLHHQGGLAAYEPREVLGSPTAKETIAVGQAFAWNPSITGTKSEDTILVGPTHNEVLTTIDNWPMLTISLPDGQSIARPAILEIS
jgi:Xaa-Pro aminopeptidase